MYMRKRNHSSHQVTRFATPSLAVLLSLPLFLVSGCPPTDDTTPTDGITNPDGIFTLFSHPDDPRLLQFRADGGQLITAYGDRDADGVPTHISALFMQEFYQEPLGTGTWTHFDDQDRLLRIVAVDGAVLNLEWQSDTTFLLNAISGDSTGQVNTIVDLSEGGGRIKRPDRKPAAPIPAKAFPSQTTMEGETPDTNSTLVVVNLHRCGATPDDHEVDSVVVTLEGASPPISFPAVRLDSGRYAAKVSWTTKTTVDEEKITKICQSLGNIALKACKDDAYRQKLQDLLCGKLAASINAASITGGPADSLQQACIQGFATMMGYCVLLQGAAEANSQGDFVCLKVHDVLAEALSETQPAIVSATAVVRGSGSRKSAETIDITNSNLPGGSPPPQLTIDFGAEAQVISAETIPADPAPGEGYVFRVKVACAAGKQYIVSVSGSDGYFNFADFWPDNQGDTFELAIPGGAQSVQDTIKFADKIEDKTLRVIAVVF
jgi:hypothetical protein